MGNKCIGGLETKSTVVTLEILKDHYTLTHRIDTFLTAFPGWSTYLSEI